uniref:Uncharacterized protein n=1 Tax=Romanomermis culicivorax TaxID=13658 RepID=A0A915KRB8_ROMCU
MENNTTDAAVDAATYSERAIIGTSQILASSFMIFNYVAVLYVIIKDKRFFYDPYYVITLNMGISDIIQLWFNGILGGLICIMPFDVPHAVKHIAGTAPFGSWYAYIFLSQSLALNRLCAVYWPRKIRSVFSLRNTLVLTVACWCHGLVWTIIFVRPSIDNSYDPDWYTQIFAETEEATFILDVMTVIDFTHSFTVFSIYSLLFLKVIKTRQFTSFNSPHRNMERKVLLQSLIVCCMDSSAAIFYDVTPFLPQSRFLTLAANWTWMLCTGNCPLVFLAFNRQLRDNVKKHIFRINAPVVQITEVKSTTRILSIPNLPLVNRAEGRISQKSCLKTSKDLLWAR